MLKPKITDFISKFDGGARPNRYEVLLTFPAGVPNMKEKLAFTCKAANLPASSVAKIEVPYMSRMIQVSGDRTFEDWSITVINDTKFEVRNAFEIWLSNINDHSENTSRSGWQSPKRYYADAILTHYDREGEPSKKIAMRGIFPTEMASIALGWGSNSEIEEFGVTFAVNWWETLPLRG